MEGGDADGVEGGDVGGVCRDSGRGGGMGGGGGAGAGLKGDFLWSSGKTLKTTEGEEHYHCCLMFNAAQPTREVLATTGAKRNLRRSRYSSRSHFHLVKIRSCVKVEVAVLGSPSLTVLMVSVDVKQH